MTRHSSNTDRPDRQHSSNTDTPDTQHSSNTERPATQHSTVNSDRNGLGNRFQQGVTQYVLTEQQLSTSTITSGTGLPGVLQSCWVPTCEPLGFLEHDFYRSRCPYYSPDNNIKELHGINWAVMPINVSCHKAVLCSHAAYSGNSWLWHCNWQLWKDMNIHSHHSAWRHASLSHEATWMTRQNRQVLTTAARHSHGSLAAATSHTMPALTGNIMLV